MSDSISRIIRQYNGPTRQILNAMRRLEQRQTLTYDDGGRVRIETATCGTCGGSWNDAAISSSTPTPSPSGRCPFEYDHVTDGDDPALPDDGGYDPDAPNPKR